MALTRLTKITGPGVATDTNWVGNNADFTGITTTATSFNIGVTTIHSTLIEAHNIVSTGIVTATGGSFSGNVTAVDGTFSGNVSIAGTLTYEDVTNIDSVGIITAPALDIDDFLDVGSNIKLGNAGVITATSFVGSGAALTGIDATAIKDSGGNVKIQAQASGAIHTGVSTFQDIDVDGHTNLDNVSIAGVTTVANDTEFIFGSNATATRPLKISHTSSGARTQITGTYQDYNTSDLRIKNISNGQHFAYFWSNQISLFANGGEKLQITGSSVNILNANLSVNNDIDVDGHTNLDNVSVAGVSTFTGNIDANGDLDVDGHTNLDNVSIAGVTTITGSGNALEIVGGLVRSRGTASARFVANNGSSEGYFGWSSGVLTVGQASATLSLEATGSNHIQLKTNGSERLRITSAGTVGINRTSPNHTLEVGGNVYITSNTSTANEGGGLLFQAKTGGFNSTSCAAIKGLRVSDTSSYLVFETGGTTERLRITSGGSVLINKNSPHGSIPFQVKGSSSGVSDGAQIVSIGTGNGSSGTQIAFGVNEDNYTWIRSYESAVGARDLVFYVNGENLRIHSNGKISTGFDSDSYELTIGGISGGPTLWLRDSTTSGTSRIMFGSSDGALDGAIYYKTDSNYLAFYTNGTEHIRIDQPGNLSPVSDASRDLGTSSLRWRNVYTTDLQLSNENTGGNEVDGTEGNWTLQEGESDVYMINRKTGKKYKMMLQEVS